MASEIQSNITPRAMRSEQTAHALAQHRSFPGKWTEDDYLQLVDEYPRTELVNGYIEILPMTTPLHQRIVAFLYGVLLKWTETANSGEAYFAPLPLKLFPETTRQPDVLLMPNPLENLRTKSVQSARVVMEVVSEGSEDRKRDYKTKREEYAKAGIPEYWIVDPDEKAVTVLKLVDSAYIEHGRFEGDQIATSAVLQGFTVACGELWAIEKMKPKSS